MESPLETGKFQEAAQAYDALLIVSFGGPEGMADVMPFLENVLRGRNVPHERMLQVAHHYELFGGVSPINGQNRALIAALTAELEAHGPHLPIYWGNRNWTPLLADTLRQMANDGVKNALAFFTSAYSSYSGCRQYREDIIRARAEVGPDAPRVDKIRMFYNHPAFIQVNVENLQTALSQIPAERQAATQIAFTAHSIPLAMAQHSDYETQLLETCQLVTESMQPAIQRDHWQLVYQSRSGSPRQPWLEPDICDHLRQLKTNGAQDVIVMPIGFISDHLEILYDLDTEAKQLASEIDLNFVRAATAGTHPTFVSMIRDLMVERMSENPVRLSLGTRGPNHDLCPIDCCLPG
ncbi:MAG: ferrochelatase [Chloroflexota bacterium]